MDAPRSASCQRAFCLTWWCQAWWGILPPFSDTSLVFFCSHQPLSRAGIRLTSNCSRGSKKRSYCQAELTCVFDHSFQAHQSRIHSCAARIPGYSLSLIISPVVSFFVLCFLSFDWVSIVRWVAGRHRQPFPSICNTVWFCRKITTGPMIYVKLNRFVGSVSWENF